jgi:post-segregation antitoxin (ccd killing protein)
MQVTVTIPDEIAAQIRARGLTVESYLEKLISEQTGKSETVTGAVNKQADLERFFEEMAAHSDKIPLLPDEAFSRESIYREND